MKWFVYIVEGKDESLYTGITTNIERREKEHNTNSKLGAKSLRGKRPVKMVYYESHSTQSEARKREAAIKGWRREKKLILVEKDYPEKSKRLFRAASSIGRAIPS